MLHLRVRSYTSSYIPVPLYPTLRVLHLPLFVLFESYCIRPLAAMTYAKTFSTAHPRCEPWVSPQSSWVQVVHSLSPCPHLKKKKKKKKLHLPLPLPLQSLSVIPNIIPSERGHTRSLATCPTWMASAVTRLGGQSEASRTATLLEQRSLSLVNEARECTAPNSEASP
ncbi:hypothetical protein BDD12DRAFT_505158 [Trichophaea hybrida]|nr:hypothetical protein BDD12DRAFT_505158 [Trichophaea hybrida]